MFYLKTYRAVNTTRLEYKPSDLMFCGEIIVFSFGNHTNYTKAM